MSMGLMFGTAGLPHILMRFFTVNDAKGSAQVGAVRLGIVAYFFNVIILMGLCAILIVGQNPEFFEGGNIGGKLIGGGNMVAMHLSKAVGGNMLLGFLAAGRLRHHPGGWSPAWRWPVPRRSRTTSMPASSRRARSPKPTRSVSPSSPPSCSA